MNYLHSYNSYQLNEKLVLQNYDLYANLVGQAFADAPKFDAKVVKHWEALKKSNYVWFKRLTSKANIIVVSGDDKYKDNPSNILIDGKEYPLIYWKGGQPYDTAKQMMDDYNKNKTLYISQDNTNPNHPIFSQIDTIVFRSVHDYIVHILGKNAFGQRGEIKAYNLHAKLAPPLALPALFTMVVGQVGYYVKFGEFPSYKIAVLNDFDFIDVGKVKGYDIINKKLIKKI